MIEATELAQLKAIVRESVFEEDLEIHPTDHLVTDLGLDSMGYVDLTVKIELTFGIAISDKAIRAVATFQDLVHLITQTKTNG
ncbi:MAG: acyl carrier protein [Salibacteraceae bacterium]